MTPTEIARHIVADHLAALTVDTWEIRDAGWTGDTGLVARAVDDLCHHLDGILAPEPEPLPVRGCVLPDNHHGDCVAGDGRAWPGPHPGPAPDTPGSAPNRAGETTGAGEPHPRTPEPAQANLARWSLTVDDPRDTPKMLRETLCVAQTAVNEHCTSADRRDIHIARLNRLITEIDRHRPLGRDGKHGTGRCTPTCGCEPPTRQADLEPTPDAPSGPAPDLEPAGDPECDTCSGTGWIKQEPQIGVPGSGVTHGCPDCETGRVRLAAGELRDDDEPEAAHPGSQPTGARQKLRRIGRIVAEMRDQHLDGYADQLERLAEGLRSDWNRVTSELAQAQPAAHPGDDPEPPGWNQATILDLIDRSLANAADDEVDEVKALLADRDDLAERLEKVSQLNVEHLRQRDEARAELAERTRERDSAENMLALALKQRDDLRAELDTERGTGRAIAARDAAAAALRWAAKLASEPFGHANDGDLDSTELRRLADQVLAGEITIPTSTEEQP